RKVTAQRAENNQKNYKKDNFYIISIEIVFFHLSRYFMSQPLLYIIVSIFLVMQVGNLLQIYLAPMQTHEMVA
ncbi:hypothetical protein, partial [Staphylococcus hominis]|uniref:hypothetical protein n=1 Tax=Staphylococcus hominis TaxID=1290 RepID=UPI001F5CC645